jgi:23S rRNA (cytosine1962-C5)-methyltransferase
MHAGFSTGLFLDIKYARQRVRRHVKAGDQVLNLFSYTGGFSIAAARAGAARVIEVDTSAHWLNWAKENQKLNEVMTIRQRREEAVKFLHKQKDETFDLIICDPPTYSSQKSGARFNVAAGFDDMVDDLLRVLRPGGHALASTNSRSLARQEFLKIFSKHFELVEEIPSSEDFAGDDYLKVGLFRKRG